jgi:hypothetical protein
MHNNHLDCCPNSQDSTPLPTRVIDVSPTDDLPSLKVFEIRGEPGTFVALSHCWGTQARFVLDSNSLIQLLGGMDLNRLLPTFRNTVNVTRALGYRYLWIDSLCILQGSYDSWGNESSKMQDYYIQRHPDDTSR